MNAHGRYSNQESATQFHPEAMAAFGPVSTYGADNAVSLLLERMRGTLLLLQQNLEGDDHLSDRYFVAALDSCAGWAESGRRILDAAIVESIERPEPPPCSQNKGRDLCFSPEEMASFGPVSAGEAFDAVSLILERMAGTILLLKKNFEGADQLIAHYTIAAIDSCDGWAELAQKILAAIENNPGAMIAAHE